MLEFIENITNEYQIFNFENFEGVQNYVEKKNEYKVSVITILQLPYLSHEPLLEGETKVRS